MDGPPPPEEDFSQIPVLERLKHKNWKARLSAYEQLSKTFQATGSDTDPAFKPYLSDPDILKNMVTDSNAVAQEKGVECVVSFVKYAGETAAKTREVVVPALVEKCLGSARAGTRNHGVELILQYTEVENTGAGVAADVLSGLSAKQPKTVSNTVLVLKELIRAFGTQVIQPQKILKTLPKIFGHSDKTVRAEGTSLVQCLYQAIGVAIEPFLSDLKPVQVKELHETFDALDKEGKGKGTLKPERFTRQQARDAEQAALTGEDPSAASGAVEEEPEPDPRMLSEEVDVVSKLPSGYSTLLNSSKWKERKEALDGIFTALDTLRIKEAPELTDLIKALAGRMGDANISCVIVAANCIEALAKGLMQAFARHREAVVPPLLGKLKERKQNVTDALGHALDAVFTTTSLPDILGDVGPFLADKNPQIKEGTLKFLHRSLQKTTLPPSSAQIKPLSESLAALLGDSAAGVRDDAALALGTLMKIVGERPLNPVLEPLDASRKSKVKEAFEQATVRCKAGSAPKPPPVAVKEVSLSAAKKKSQTASKKPAEEKKGKGTVEADTSSSTAPAVVLEEDPPAKPLAKPPARLLAKKTATSAASASSAESAPAGGPAKKTPAASATAASKSAKPPPSAPGALDTFKYKYTSEDAEVLASSLVPEGITAGFSDANWKIRLAAVEEMGTWLEGIIADVDSEVIVRFIAKKGWNEKNFQVSAKLYGIVSMLAEKCPSFGRPSAAFCVGHLSEKLGDLKLKKPAGDTLFLLAEKTSLSFVLNQVYEPLGKQKAPKVLADSIVWINQALTEFGIAGLSLRNLIEFLKTALKNSNATVRSSATTALITVKLFAGSGIKDLLEDLNPQLLTTIHAEFDKVEGQNPPDPTRTSTDLALLPQTNDNRKSKVGDPLDDLFPRVDLDKLLVGTTILADAKSDAWKSRKEGLEALQGLLDIGANKRLKPIMGDIGQVLKARLTDTNKAVQLLALDVVGRIAAGMNKPFEKHARLFIVPLTAALSDQKTNIRAVALQTLTAIANACEGIDIMIAGLGTGLESPNPLQRASILTWITGWYKDKSPASDYDLLPWASHVVSCLEDRNGDVRKGAQAVLPIIIKSIGFDKVMKETSSLKPASRSTVIPLIQAAKALMADNPPASSSSTTPATTSVASAEPANTKPEPVEAARQSPSPQSAAPATYGNGRLTGVRSKKILPNIVRPDSQLSTREEEPASAHTTKLGAGGLKRPAGAASSKPTIAVSTSSTSFYFNGSSLESKKSRLSKDSSRWVFDSNTVRKDASELLQHQMEGHVSRDLISLLFSTSHNPLTDNISGLDLIVDCYASAVAGEEKFAISVSEMQSILLANSDLPLKYISMKVHEPQPNLISKCLDAVDNVLSLLRTTNHQVSDAEALCFIPTLIHKLGDSREVIRTRVGQIIQTLPKVYAYSRLFQLLLEHGLRSKVSKTRQGTLEELESILKRAGIGVCDPSKSMPIIASMISDKDPYVRKAALSTLSEGYILVGDKIWTMVGTLSPKDKTQLEERLRRIPLPETKDTTKPFAIKPPTSINNLQPSSSNPPASSAVTEPPRSMSPSSLPRVSKGLNARPASPSTFHNDNSSKLPTTSTRSKSMLPSRLGPHRARPNTATTVPDDQSTASMDRRALQPLNGTTSTLPTESTLKAPEISEIPAPSVDNGVTVVISSILSHDPSRSVDALKKIQKILEISPEEAHLSRVYIELSEHVEGLIETIALQMGHVFENPETVYEPESFRLAKHLNQTLNAFCDHPLLAEALSVDTVTGLLDELTLRLLQTDDSHDSKVKDLSRFINMIILRLFATCRRIVIFRALFRLLLQIVRPFPSNNTQATSQEAKVAELVLKCVWKLARNIPSDLSKQLLDPVELFPAIEYFLQSVPPNEWRARATNKIPAGDMPLRTIKVIVQHIVAQYGDEVYEKLSAAFEDPSATIVYPYVYRILNSNPAVRPVEEPGPRLRSATIASETMTNQHSETIRHSAPVATVQISTGTRSARSSQYSVESDNHRSLGGSPQRAERPTVSMDDDDPDAQLIKIISNISSETTGALHKEGITQLHKFLKAYPHKKPRVDKLLDSTGPAFRKYIARALASRAAEDDEREVAVADTLSRLESVRQDVPRSPMSTGSSSPRRLSVVSDADDTKLSRLHDLFGYHGRATRSSAGSASSSPATNQRFSGSVDADGTLKHT